VEIAEIHPSNLVSCMNGRIIDAHDASGVGDYLAAGGTI
jgi:hypothetical protein